jgi:SAM-dependent methyltransferase
MPLGLSRTGAPGSWLGFPLRSWAGRLALNRNPARGVQRSSPGLVDDEYASGRWDYLGGLPELPRYAVVAGYCSTAGEGFSALDLGCGTGVLLKRLIAAGCRDYVGVDLSAVATERGAKEHGGSGEFIAADVAAYTPARSFDRIIFNEVLYYFPEPALVVQRYAQHLNSNGSFVISLWEGLDGELAWRRASEALRVLDETYLRNGEGTAWHVRLCAPMTK